MTDAVASPPARAAARNEGASPRGASGVLSTKPWMAGSTPRNIDAWAGTVSGGTTVRAVKHDAPERASAHRFGIVPGVTNEARDHRSRSRAPAQPCVHDRSPGLAGASSRGVQWQQGDDPREDPMAKYLLEVKLHARRRQGGEGQGRIRSAGCRQGGGGECGGTLEASTSPSAARTSRDRRLPRQRLRCQPLARGGGRWWRHGEDGRASHARRDRSGSRQVSQLLTTRQLKAAVSLCQGFDGIVVIFLTRRARSSRTWCATTTRRR